MIADCAAPATRQRRPAPPDCPHPEKSPRHLRCRLHRQKKNHPGQPPQQAPPPAAETNRPADTPQPGQLPPGPPPAMSAAGSPNRSHPTPPLAAEAPVAGPPLPGDDPGPSLAPGTGISGPGHPTTETPSRQSFNHPHGRALRLPLSAVSLPSHHSRAQRTARPGNDDSPAQSGLPALAERTKGVNPAGHPPERILTSRAPPPYDQRPAPATQQYRREHAAPSGRRVIKRPAAKCSPPGIR